MSLLAFFCSLNLICCTFWTSCSCYNIGKIKAPLRRAGLNFKLPFIQSVYPFLKTQVQPEKFETLTKDLQVIRATATVKYSVKPNEAGRIFAAIASRNSDVYQKIVQPSLLKALKSVFLNELETIATEFAVISEKVGDTVAKELNSFDYVDVKSLDLTGLRSLKNIELRSNKSK